MASAVSGCANQKGDAGDAKAEAAAVLAPEAPVAGAGNGLEVRWWLADDEEGAVSAALESVDERETWAGVSPQMMTRWEANGLHWARYPITRLSDVEHAVPALRTRSVTWLGSAVEWTEIFRGSRQSRPGTAGAVVVTSEGGKPVAAGQLRMLARCWVSPTARDSGLMDVLRLELAVQSHDRARAVENNPFARPEIVKQEKQGQVLKSLTIETALEPGYIYVVTTQARAEGASSTAQYGPASPTPATVSEALLTAVLPESREKRVEAVVVLVPRVKVTGPG